MKVERQAEVIWEGDLLQGSGYLKIGSGITGNQPISWASRIGPPDGKISPEELMASAHASCYAMALSNTLAHEGKPAERLVVTARCTLEGAEFDFKITSMILDIRGKVPGLDAAQFEQAVQKSEQACPVSNALRNNVDIRVNAHLELE